MIHSSQVDAAADGQDELMADGSLKDMTAVHALQGKPAWIRHRYRFLLRVRFISEEVGGV